jgi:hypothetical protein
MESLGLWLLLWFAVQGDASCIWFSANAAGFVAANLAAFARVLSTWHCDWSVVNLDTLRSPTTLTLTVRSRYLTNIMNVAHVVIARVCA